MSKRKKHFRRYTSAPVPLCSVKNPWPGGNVNVVYLLEDVTCKNCKKLLGLK